VSKEESIIVNYEFNLSEWLPRFSLDQEGFACDGALITGPVDICNNEVLRKRVQRQVTWGVAVPVDVFIMAKGEPPDRHVTKLGGLPYRPADKPWPKQTDGKPMTFIGQICFADSKDLTGGLPGDVLLMFAPSPVEVVESLVFEWYPLAMTNLMPAKKLPKQPWQFHPCYGYIYRAVNFPKAKPKPKYKTSLTYRGREVFSEYYLFQYQATQIGRAPFYIQGEPGLPGQPLCTISSIGTNPHSPWPWVNHPEPVYRPDESYRIDEGNFMYGDTGCIYISMDDACRLHFTGDSF
jgi:hypothetical protein